MSTGDTTQLHNMSAPSRTEVKSVQVPAGGQPVIFSMPHACLAAGLIEPVGADLRDWQALARRCYEKWGMENGTGSLLHGLAGSGITMERVDARAENIRGALIGWAAYHGDDQTAKLKEYLERRRAGFCDDLELTLAVLSRCVAGLFLPRRSPDYSARTLFLPPFCVCDRRFTAPTLKQAPWAKLGRKGGAA